MLKKLSISERFYFEERRAITIYYLMTIFNMI